MKTLSRRTFLSQTAALATTGPSVLAGPHLSGYGAGPGPNESIRVALIGCGGMGLGDLKTFLAYPEVQCPVVCDVDDAHTGAAIQLVEGARGQKPDGVRDFRRVLDRNDVDALLVATPDHWHALPTIHGCETGRDVYVEKPLAKTVAEGRAMREAARRHKRVVQLGTQWRSGQHYGDAVSFVKSGQLGRVRMVRAWAYLDWVGGIGHPADCDPPPGVDYDLWLGPAPKRPFNPNRFHFNFRWFWDYAGGLMTDWGVHLLNVCLWAMGPAAPLRVSSYGGKRIVDDHTDTPDTQITTYDFPDYTLVFEHQLKGGIGVGGRPHGMSFCGSEGTLIVDANGWEVVREPEKTLVPFKRDASEDGRPAHVGNFLDCMKSRQQPVQNLEIGHFVTTVAQLGNVAYRAAREIRWDTTKERVEGDREANALLTTEYRKPWKLPDA